MTFAKAQVKRLIKKSGGKRVSKDAVNTLSQLMEDKALEVTAKALKFAKYAKRRTVKASDFEMTQL
jgi:histone H3/H4